MKKVMFGFVMVAVLVATFAFTGSAFAQTAEYGRGPGGGGGYRGGAAGETARGTQDGILHDELMAAFAEALGLTVDELNTRLANGERMSQIALAEGFTVEEFQTLMVDARAEAIAAALAAGEITQEQADWLLTRGFRMNGRGGAGGGMQYSNPDCPMVP